MFWWLIHRYLVFRGDGPRERSRLLTDETVSRCIKISYDFFISQVEKKRNGNEMKW